MPADAQRRALSGDFLWGDDFTDFEIQEWFRDEEHAYADMYADTPEYAYEHEALNRRHGFDRLPDGVTFDSVLGFGAAYGDELRPLGARIGHCVIVESADLYRGAARDQGFPVEWRQAIGSGHIDAQSEAFDLVCCLGVLHHIPNVTFVLGELVRVAKPGAHILLREPIISMGDWQRPRRGLTPRERGIPLSYFRRMLRDLPVAVVHEIPCGFSLLSLIDRRSKLRVFNNKRLVALDAFLSRASLGTYRYHGKGPWQKIRPTSVYYVLRKNG